MASQVSAPNRYYWYKESSLTVYYGTEFPLDEPDVIYIGTSNNPIPSSAATAFMQNTGKPSGWKVEQFIP